MNITRFHNLDKIDVEVEFLTPTFLGGADQNAELRSAPFKNLLRQWWRVANGHLSVEQLRTKEGELFGTVLGEHEATTSRIRISLKPTAIFSLSNAVINLGKTPHPEVKGGMPVDNSIYLGYGPVQFGKPAPVIRQYIKPGSIIQLNITCPRSAVDQIVNALQLIDAFGAIGSRSRNSFGSIALVSDMFENLNPAAIQTKELAALVGVSAPQYPNHFGRDSKGMFLWDAKVNNWEDAMKLLAKTYLSTRTDVNIAGNPNELHERHILGFPVTNHDRVRTQDWDRNGRMPSQLRLMVKRNQNNQLVARILHLPHKLPKPWPANMPSELSVWQQVHAFLDRQGQFHRIGGNA